MDRFIPLSVPNIGNEEIEYVTNALQTGWVSSAGPYVDQFEKKISEYVHSLGAVSCQNGTAGLHIALKLCGVEYADEVIVPTLTFIASVNPVKYLGAEPIFMDCDDDLNMDLFKLEEYLANNCEQSDKGLINKRSKRVIKAIVITHIFGNMTDMEKLMKIAKEYKLYVIEDAAEAIGTYCTVGKYEGRYAGTIGDVGVYSFNGNKIITTGGGGMIVSNDMLLLKRAKHLVTQAKTDELKYIHDEIGYNYRMTNMQAAMGLAQLEKLESFIQKKKENYEIYKEGIQKIEHLKLLDFNEFIRPNYWFYSVFVENSYPYSRDELIASLLLKHIQSRPVWGLIHEQEPYKNSESYKVEKALVYGKQIFNVPCSTNLENEEVEYILSCL